jgi:uncharacterized membrane protein HdeD (DUF308 family)
MDETPGTNQATGSTPPPGGAAPGQDAASGEEQALAVTKDLVDKGAPWKAGMKWSVVMAEGVVLAVAGLLVWLAPSTSGRTVLQVLGIILLVTAALSAWRLLRDHVAPGRIAIVAFRSGVGLSVGLIVVIGSLVAQNGDLVTVAIAIILGIGLILYGLSAVAAALVRREPGSRFPVVALVLAGLTIVVGLLLVLTGRNGIDSLESAFTLLGILLLLVGLVLCGYAWMLRSRDQAEPAE